MTSLLDTSTEQPELIPSSEMDAAFFGECKVTTRNPEYTAERYAKHFPEEYRIMASLLFGDMLPIATVARMLGRSRNLVDAVYAREAGSKSVEHLKQQASREYRHLGKLGREALREYLLNLPEASKLDANQLGSMIQRISVAIGISDEKAELLSGGATARIEHTGSESGHEGILDYLKRLQDEYRRRMGSNAGNDPVNEAIPVAADVSPAQARPGPAAALEAHATEIPERSPDRAGNGQDAAALDRESEMDTPKPQCLQGNPNP